MDSWDPTTERPALSTCASPAWSTGVGDRVRLWPLEGADIMDLALKGKTAVIAALEQDYEDRIHLAVTVDDDPGRDLGVDGKARAPLLLPAGRSRTARRPGGEPIMSSTATSTMPRGS